MILEDILEAIKKGLVPEPFVASDLARALQQRFWSSGSYAAVLARYSRGDRREPALFVRVSRGRYRLAAQAAATRSKRKPSQKRPRAAAGSPTSR